MKKTDFTTFYKLQEVINLSNEIVYVYLDENKHPIVKRLNKEKEHEKD